MWWLNVLWMSFHVVFNYGNSAVKYSNKSLLYLSAYYVYWYSNNETCGLFFIVKVNWEYKITTQLCFVLTKDLPFDIIIPVITVYVFIFVSSRWHQEEEWWQQHNRDVVPQTLRSPLRDHVGELQQHQVWNEKEDVKQRPHPHLLLQRRGVQRHADVHAPLVCFFIPSF